MSENLNFKNDELEELKHYKNHNNGFLITPYIYSLFKKIKEENKISFQIIENKYIEYLNTKEYRLYSLDFIKYFNGKRII
jgi:rRNA-processing protein FCF1